MYIDNQSAMKLAKHLMTKPASRHILLRYHWLRDQVRDGRLKLEYVNTDDNLADPFTKVLPKFKIRNLLILRECSGSDTARLFWCSGTIGVCSAAPRLLLMLRRESAWRAASIPACHPKFAPNDRLAALLGLGAWSCVRFSAAANVACPLRGAGVNSSPSIRVR